MLAAQRRDVILAQVEAQGAITVAAMARLLEVSEMTVRRDLDALDREGLITKVHGGATPPRPGSAREPGFAAKATLAEPAKLAIARAAATLVSPGDTVGLTAGTTTFQVARHLVGIEGITIVTNSIRVAEVFHDVDPGALQVIVIGGNRTPSDALVGPMAVSALQSLNVDLCFMGVHGMTEHSGFTTPNVLEADTNRAFAAAARRLIVVADSSKWGAVGLARIAPLSDASSVITDEGLTASARQSLQANVEHVVFVHPEEQPVHA